MTNSAYFPYDTLTKANGGDEDTDAYEFRVGLASMGACLVHNTIQSLHRNHIGLFDKLIRVSPIRLGDYGTRVLSFDGRVLRYHLPFHRFGLVELDALASFAR